MLSLDGADPRFVRVAAPGLLGRSDYDAFEPAFEDELSRRTRPVAMLLDLDGFRGWTLGGLLRDLRFDLRHRNAFSRVAVVGDRSWHRWLTYAAVPIFRCQLRFFPSRERGLALGWLSSQRRDGAE